MCKAPERDSVTSEELEEKAEKTLRASETYHEARPGRVDRKEVEANQHGAALLMPKSLVQNEIKSQNLNLDDDEAIDRLAKRFQVSIPAMTNRLMNLQMLT